MKYSNDFDRGDFNYILHISQITEEDYGKYECYAANQYGNDTADVNLMKPRSMSGRVLITLRKTDSLHEIKLEN